MQLDEVDTEDDQLVVETSLLECNTWDSVSVAKRRGMVSGRQGSSPSVEVPCVLLTTGSPQRGM